MRKNLVFICKPQRPKHVQVKESCFRRENNVFIASFQQKPFMLRGKFLAVPRKRSIVLVYINAACLNGFNKRIIPFYRKNSALEGSSCPVSAVCVELTLTALNALFVSPVTCAAFSFSNPSCPASASMHPLKKASKTSAKKTGNFFMTSAIITKSLI